MLKTFQQFNGGNVEKWKTFVENIVESVENCPLAATFQQLHCGKVEKWKSFQQSLWKSGNVENFSTLASLKTSRSLARNALVG